MKATSVFLGLQLLPCFAVSAVALQSEGGTWFGPSWCAPESGARLGSGDFNGDGRSDVYCNDTSGNTSIALSQGADGFAAPTLWQPAWCAAGASTRIGSGDFDGDGDSDLYCNDIYGQTYVALSNRAGGFTGGGIWLNGWCAHNGATRFGTGDFDADGDSDIYCNASDGKTYVGLSNGSGGFTGLGVWQEAWCYNDGTTRFGTGDFDGDGDSDIYCNGIYGGVYVGLSNRVNGFALYTWHADFCANSSANRLGAADFNGDAKWDIYCTTISTGASATVLSSGSAFGAEQPWFAGNWCNKKSDSSMVAADLDGGGRADLYCHSTTQPPATAIQAATYGQAPPTATSISTCPWMFDADRGARMYMLSNDPSGDNQTLYHHQSPFIDNDWVVIRNLTAGGALYRKVNVRNCQTQELTSRGAASGAFVRGFHMYAYHYVLANTGGTGCGSIAGDAHVGMLDLAQDPPVWTHYACVPYAVAGPMVAGEVAVSSNENWLIWSETPRNDPGSSTRVRAYRLPSGPIVELYDDNRRIEHIVFSPSATDPRVFTYYDQTPAFQDPPDYRIVRVGVGRVGVLDPHMQILDLEEPISDYWTDPHNAAHAFWMPDGNLNTDVLWHIQNPPDIYDLASFAIAGSASPWIVPASSQTNRRYIPVDHWNLHFNRTTKDGWFVGEGDVSNVIYPSPYTQAGHLLPWGVRFDRVAKNYGTPDMSSGNAHMLPTRDGVLVTWRFPNANQNVWLIELSQALRDQIN
jgi:hypothetical protein